MPSPLLTKNYRALFLDLLVVPHRRALFESEFFAEELAKVLRPSVLSAFEWPTTKPLAVPPRNMSSLYVLLPQGFDYDDDGDNMWNGLTSLEWGSLDRAQTATYRLDVHPLVVPYHHCLIFFVARDTTTFTPHVHLDNLAGLMNSVQVFVFDFSDDMGGGLDVNGHGTFVQETHRRFSSIACLKVFVCQWVKRVKQKRVFRSVMNELAALPPLEHPPFPGGCTYKTSRNSFLKSLIYKPENR